MVDYTRTTEERVYENGSEYGRNLIEYIDELLDVVNKTPEEYKKKLKIYIEAYTQYDSPVVEVEVRYTRPMNQIELDAAIARERLAEDYERRQYENLKKKFG